MVIGNSLCYIFAIILNHLLIYTSKFFSDRVKGLITDLLSRGELHASKWCRRTKDDRLGKERRKEKEGEGRV